MIDKKYLTNEQRIENIHLNLTQTHDFRSSSVKAKALFFFLLWECATQ